MVVVSLLRPNRRRLSGERSRGRTYLGDPRTVHAGGARPYGEHPAPVYPLANPPDGADFPFTRKLYAREHHIPPSARGWSPAARTRNTTNPGPVPSSTP